MNLQITSGGLLAIASGGGETHAVRLTRIAIGSGRGPGGAGDADRVALRTPRDSAAVVAGDASNVARLTGSAAIAPTGSYAVSEVGVFARPVQSNGSLGDEILLAFWTHPTTDLAAAVVGVNVVVQVTIDARSASADVDLRAAITFPTPLALTALTAAPPTLPADELLGAGGGAVETLDAAAVAAMLLAAAPPRLLAFDTSGSVVAPAYACTWLVVVWGAGGAGAGEYDNTRRRWNRLVAGADGGDTTVTPAGAAAQLRAAGGAGGSLTALPARRAGSLGDVVVAGAGARGGDDRSSAGGDGDAGDLAISLVQPLAGRRYDVVIGRGGTVVPSSSAYASANGQSGRVLVLEFRR